MFKTIGKYFVKIFGKKRIGKVARWGFLSALTLWGPGPIIAVIGFEGLATTAIITQSGIIDYAGDKLL